MSDRESIKQDHINDLLARDREWADQFEWRACPECWGGIDPENAVSCEAPGYEAVMHKECAVPLDEDDATFLCPKHAEEITMKIKAEVDDQLNATLEGVSELIDKRMAELAAKDRHIAELEAALRDVAFHPHNSYDHQSNGGGQYGTGVVDGHRCAAKIARRALGMPTD